MNQYDVLVVGGGILGCFAARSLRRWNISTLLVESEDDVCKGITRANSAIVYAGYDNKTGSLKARMTVHANEHYHELCEELDVPFSRCGSLMVSFGEKGEKTLRKKLEQGNANGVPGLRLLTAQQARELEPMLSPDVTAVLYAPSTGTVNPWKLGIAAFENALHNGCKFMLNTIVSEIQKTDTGYLVKTNQGEIACRMILNCAGAHADTVQQLIYPSDIRLRLDGTDFMVMDARIEKPKHILFQEAEVGKGITAVPCVEGNLLMESPSRPLGRPYAATREGIEMIKNGAKQLFPSLDLSQVIRSFGAVRPNPHKDDKKNLPDFSIENPSPDFYSLVGIKTPGLTCADELGRYLAERCSTYLGASLNEHFDPSRKAIRSIRSMATEQWNERVRENPNYGQIVCQCMHITKGEILEAIARGAVTVDGVKRRVDAGMGHCQGSRCSSEIAKILMETGVNPDPLF